MRPFREELKFLIHHSTHRLLLERWRRYLVRAPFTNRYAVSPILSQYYDSPSLEFYHEKLAGIAYRNKVRLRVYGQAFERGQTAFLEIKQRHNNRVRKHRYRIPGFDEGYLDPIRWRIDDTEVADAFMELYERYRLRPSAQVYYQREAYEGAVETDVRVTFDTCVLGLHPRERLSRGMLFDSSRRLLSDTLVILEVKATNGVPPWVHDGVVVAELQQQTIPKYITAVEVLRLREHRASGVFA
jgi:hypothetical protein